MNVAFLLKQYFNNLTDVSIDVFDAHTLNDTYQDVLKTLTSHFEIEVSVLQALSYCFYEILDNVHIHSGRPIGTAMTHFDAGNGVLRILVADDGMGIRKSLAENEKFRNVTEEEALLKCVEDSVTDGKGMGFGLYATSRLMKDVGLQFVIHSGQHKLIIGNDGTEILENGLWQGTIIFLEISTSREINIMHMPGFARRVVLSGGQSSFLVSKEDKNFSNSDRHLCAKYNQLCRLGDMIGWEYLYLG